MPFATLTEVEDRLEWDLSEAEKRVAATAIEDLTVEAQSLGQAWSDSNVPPYVKKCVRSAAVRYMKNLEGVIQSRAGDETLIFPEAVADEMGSPHFSKAEIEGIVSSALGPAGFGTIEVYAYSVGPRKNRTGYVSAGGGDPVPFFAEGDI